jgi:recombination protein RecT
MITEVTTFAVDKLVYDVAPAFEAMCIDRSIVFAREAEFAIQALCASDYALKIARQNPQSVRDAVTNIAAIGISLNPAKKQAYLVPRKGGICLVISYMGLLDLAIQSGSILWGQAELVYAADKFTMHGFDQPPTHERNPFLKDRGELVGAYTVVKTRDGDYLTTTMTADEVFAIRNRSDAWIAYEKDNSKKCPWVTDEGEMVKKTVIKRAYKTWPKSDRLDKAVHVLNTEADEGITFPQHDPEDPLNQPKNFGLTDARAKVVRAVARASLQLFNEGDEIGAYGEASGITDNEEKEALWSILRPHSALRSCIKRMAAEEREAQDKLEKAKQHALAA